MITHKMANIMGSSLGEDSASGLREDQRQHELQSCRETELETITGGASAPLGAPQDTGLLDKLAEKEIAATGTVMNNRVPKTVKLSSESQLKQRGRGASEMWVRNDDKQVVVRWYDNKPVTLMSSLHGKEPQDTCRRWCAKEKRHIDVPRPHIVQAYNANMGGVDMADRMLSFYRMKARVKKWTIRCIFHLFDIALCNAWILYMQDMSSLREQKKDILKFLDFRMSVADVLVAQMSQLSSDDDDALWSSPEKRAPLPPSE
ncbi:hypothetical protein MRX96_048328, partial [Rhipicephalus microplus]